MCWTGAVVWGWLQPNWRKQQPKKTHVFGYSSISYLEMIENPHVTFIQGRDYDLFRYFRKPRFHLIYSSMGLLHLGTNLESRKTSAYLHKLSTILRPGGMIIFSTMAVPTNGRREQNDRHWDPVVETLKQESDITVRARGTTIIIQKKGKVH